ncbi:MAG TPA: hypothetical protein VN030_10375 [Cellvibrio sp.]|nr:hypothetical protein [Cellvibrio sp.]
MERREPTLSGGNNNEREEQASRRPTSSAYDDSRPSRATPVAEHGGSSGSGPLPAIALVIALLGVAGAGFLGWQLTQAQAALAKADSRISQLENQLNVTSTESTASVGSLQVKLVAVDNEVKKLWEVSRKTVADNTEKFNGISKSFDSTKKDIADVRGGENSLKQDALAQKAGLEEAVSRLEAQEKALVEQKKRIQDVSASVTAALSQVKSAEGLAGRLNSVEEAIDAIDDNRRTINRDLAQIKQTMGIK